MRLYGLFNFLGNSVGDETEPQDHSISLLRRKFKSIDADHSSTLSLTEMVDEVTEELASSPKHGDIDKHLLVETTKFRYSEMSLGDNDEITEDEWVHFRMLLVSSPSWVAMNSVNRWVRRLLRKYPKLVSRLLNAFADGDVKGDGQVPKEFWPKVFSPLCPDEDRVQQMCADADFNNDSFMDYFEFVARLFLGDRQPVQLAMYDISNGKAPWIPSFFLSGHKFEYIYHTGVLAFGKEYWYGGAVFESDPGETPFGEPVKIVDLGLTLRTRNELLQYVIDHLRWEYTYANYDVLHHNCNCFSDAVTQFLLNGMHIPDEVRLQPVWAEKGVAIQVIKPIMNRWLGGFGKGSDSYGSCRIDDMTDVWRYRLQAGDLAMWRMRFIDHPDIVRIVDVEYGDVMTASVLLFSPGSAAPEQVFRKGVPLRELHPVPGHATSEVLQRNRSEVCPPSCVLGHPLEAVPAFAMLEIAPCSICGNVRPRHRLQCCSARHAEDIAPLRCVRCKFEMCAACVADGCSMQGGQNGGIFTDVLTVSLARELLQRPNWLRFKSLNYFYRADLDQTRTLDKDELSHLGDRLCQELGLPPLVDELDVLTKDSAPFPTIVDGELFQKFFIQVLQKAVSKNVR